MKVLERSLRKGRVVVVGVVLVCALCSGAFGQPWDGNGVEGDPYQIWTAADMQAIGADANYWGAHFKLMANIDLGGYTGFTGVFDGNGHTISNFTYDASSLGYPDVSAVGLFNYAGDGSEIKDLDLINPNVDGGTRKMECRRPDRFQQRNDHQLLFNRQHFRI
jgi:hypothetical protein